MTKTLFPNFLQKHRIPKTPQPCCPPSFSSADALHSCGYLRGGVSLEAIFSVLIRFITRWCIDSDLTATTSYQYQLFSIFTFLCWLDWSDKLLEFHVSSFPMLFGCVLAGWLDGWLARLGKCACLAFVVFYMYISHPSDLREYGKKII